MPQRSSRSSRRGAAAAGRRRAASRKGRTAPAAGRWRRLRRGLGRLLAWTAFTLAALSVAVVLLLRWVPPPVSAVMLHQYLDGRDAGDARARIDYEWVAAERIAPALALAAVSAEDQRFPRHHGFDFDAIADAVEERLRGGRLRGASTISQQVAKNLFLWPSRSWLRKGLEVWFTALVETLWPKRRILEVYLNIAEMGPYTYGAGAAGRRYFGVPPERLSAEQAALLAAVLPNPRRLRADAPSKYVRERQRWILRQMDRLGGQGYLSGIWIEPEAR